MRLLGVLAQGENPTAQEQSDALQALNDMMESWSLEPLLIPSIVREEFPLVSGQGRYTMGPLGDFATTRPVSINHALFVLQGTAPQAEVSVDIVTKDQFANIITKSLQSAIPREMYVEGTAPIEHLNLWPVPNQGGTIVIYSSKPTGSFASVDAALDLPPGWKKALRYNLALELAPEYDREPSMALVAGATESRANLRIKNQTPQFMELDSAVPTRRRGFNFMTGE